MAYFGVPDHYEITTAPASMMRDEEYMRHNWHYKNGGQQFDAWIREVRAYTKVQLSLNYLPTMATAFIKDLGTLPDEQLFNLKKWLLGRQVCFGHHLLVGNADDTHLHPINVACTLIRILKPLESESIITECTPVNICDLVEQLGSARAREIYNEIQPLDQWSRYQNGNYWSGNSTSTSSSVSSSSQGRSRTSSFSSATSVSSWRSRSPSLKRSSSPLNPVADTVATKATSVSQSPKSQSPLTDDFKLTYSSVAVTRPKPTHTDIVKAPASTTFGSGKLVLKKRAARG